MLKNIDRKTTKTYVGFTNNIAERLKKHNSNRGAKSTKGYEWELIYKKKFYSKSKALSFEYKLKKDRKERFIFLYSCVDICMYYNGEWNNIREKYDRMYPILKLDFLNNLEI